MKRLLTSLLLLTALIGTSLTLRPHMVHANVLHATIPANFTSSCDSSDGSNTHYNEGTQNISGFSDEGDACLTFDPNFVPSQCSESDLCWDVQAATNISSSVFQTFADAGGWDQCDGGEWVNEMFQSAWENGSSGISPTAYGPIQTCSINHDYHGDYGHLFKATSSSGSNGWTTCEFDTPTGCI